MLRIHFKTVLTIVLASLAIQSSCQSTGTILVITNLESSVFLDSEEIGLLEPGKPGKFQISVGQHYLQVISVKGKMEQNEILEIASGKQLVLKYEFEEGNDTELVNERIRIAEIDFNIPGIVTAAALDDFEYPTYLYAFEEGDQIVLNVEMTNAKGTNVIEVYTLSDENLVYSKDSFVDLKEVMINVREREIFVFTFRSNHAFDRDARFTIERIPKSELTRDFSTSVSWQETFTVEVIQKPQKFYINSGSNATFKGGKSRVLLPLNFPENTVKWYYTFSSDRDKEKIESVSNALNLASELSGLIDNTGILGFGIDQLTQPPGSNFCDIYLVDHQNSSLFTSKLEYQYYTEGSRENLTSGVVEVECCMEEPMYLGFKNPDNIHGLHVVVEVAAIVKGEGWVMNAE